MNQIQATRHTANDAVALKSFDDICALSPLQREVFSDPNQGLRPLQAIWTIHGVLDAQMLKQSWELVARRHPVLRTVLRRTRQQSVQIIRTIAPLSLSIHNLSHDSQEEQGKRLKYLVQKESHFSFDLAEGPLFRVSAFRLSHDHFQSLLTFHPVLLDRLSVEMIHSETASIYDALQKNEAPPEQDVPAIKDFILWLKRQDSSEALRYWRHYLDGAAATHFPEDGVGSGSQEPAISGMFLSSDLTSAVKKLANQHHLSVATVFLAAWAILLGRYSGATDVVCGLVVDGRPPGLNGIGSIAGAFAHALPVRIRLQAGQNLEDLLHVLGQQVININRYSYVPFSEVQAFRGASPSERLFNTCLEFVKPETGTDNDTQFLRDQTGSGYQAHRGLTLQVADGVCAKVSISHEDRLFEGATIDGLLAAFQQLLENVVSNPQGLTIDLDIVSAPERARVLALAQGVVLHDQPLWRRLGVTPGSEAKVYVLDQQHHLVPIGCSGEIAVSSTAPEQQSAGAAAQNYAPNPFSSDHSGSLWFTGQKARWKPDGRLEFSRDPDSTVAAIEKDGTEGYIAPRTDIEKLVSEVWKEVLGVPQVGLNDQLFDLGGHSLNTIQIRSRISQRLGVNVPLKTIFTNPVLEAQARAVAALKAGQSGAEQSIPRLPQRTHYPLSYAQKRLWFLQRLDPEDRFYHTADCIQLDGPLNRPAFAQAIQALIQRQEILRTSFRLIADEPVQCISDSTLELSFHDLSGLDSQAQEQPMRKLQEQVPKWLCNLEVPPVGALLVKLAEERHVFILAVHHILSDGWSGQVVTRDLIELYSAACRQQRPQLAEIRVRYVDFAVWQKERIENGKLAESERYWLTRLGGQLPKLNLPLDNIQDWQAGGDLLTETISSGAELAKQLVRIGQGEAATSFMVKLAVFKAFLSRITGQQDILLGSTTAGRDHPDIESLVGFFVNVVALRTHLGGDPKFTEVVHRVKQSCVEAYAHQEYPFDLLVQHLAPVRDARQFPIVESFFTELPRLESKTIEGVRFSAVDVSGEIAKGLAGRKLPVPIGMVCQETGDGSLAWHLLLRAGCFSSNSAQRLAHQFKAFLSSLATHSDLPLSQISIGFQKTGDTPQQLADGGKVYPLSLSQRDMWVENQVHRDIGLNNVAVLETISGPLNVKLFHQALQTVVDQHDALRAIFVEIDGAPCQKILATVPVLLPILDISGKDEEDQKAIVREKQRQIMGAPYDFGAGPLFRAELLRLQENQHALIFGFSHLVLDAFSWPKLLEEAASVYEILLKGLPATLSPPDLQYSDFAIWQDERLRQGLLRDHETYWQEQLQAPLPVMNLPGNKDTSAVRGFELDLAEWQVRDDVFKSLKTFRERYRMTLFRTVLAAFGVLLRKMVGEKELLLGMSVSSLPPQASRALGLFGHPVPVRITVDDHQPFTHLLSDVSKAVARAKEHREYPLCEAIRQVQVTRDLHRPLFPVLVSQVTDLDCEVGELRLTMDNLLLQSGFYHLCLMTRETDDGLQLRIHYNRELLAGAPMVMIQECFNELLAQIAVNPETAIEQLDMVSAAARETIFRDLAGAISSPTDNAKGIVARIEHHAQERPQATAAVCGTAELSYELLNQKSNRMAHWLRGQGIGQESRIGIFGSRSLEMLTTLLSVLKAGAAFVPLDSEHPDARLHSVLKNAHLNVLVTSAELLTRSRQLAAGVPNPPTVICWHDLGVACGVPNPISWEDQPASDLAVTNAPHDLAYICHTSGSTGMPKGGMIEHRGVLNHLLAKISFLGLDEHSVVAQNASHCFDISIWQFFAALLVGGRVVIYPPESLFHPGSMLSLIHDDAVTVLETVPSLLEVMLSEFPAQATLTRLRHLISNAELLPVPLSRRWQERFPQVVLANTYGATECSDDTTHQVVRNVTEATVRIPVGRSIAGAQHYVLDPEMQLLPAGCAGQIAIGGDVVGRGYLADPATTARTFVPDPFRGDGSRIYLTGDLGRWNSAGELEFLGRADNQIKLHGHRVELGDIETALAKVGGVRQVAVIVEEEQAQRLLAYWAGNPGVDDNELRDCARRELPPYMVPNAFIHVPALPLTSNGKVNRAALPKPADARNDGFVPPRDEIEFRLAKIWRDELGISGVGIFDNFFDRGGHSLKAVSLMNRIQTEFKVNLPLRTLFDHQTIDRLSRVLRHQKQNAGESDQLPGRLVWLQAGNTASLPLFLVHPHGGTVFCYQALVTALGNQAPVIGIQCRGLEEGEQPLSSIPEMATEYIKDIRQAQPQGPYRIAGWSLGGPIAFEIARQLEANDLKVAFLGIFDSFIPSSTGKSLEQMVPQLAGMSEVSSEIPLSRFAKWFFGADESQFSGLSNAQVLDALAAMAQRAGMLPPGVAPAMVERFVAMVLASAVAMFRYLPAGPVQAEVVLFRAAQSQVDPRWWVPWTHGEVRTVSVDGTHHNMVFPPAVQTLAAALREELGDGDREVKSL